MEGETEPVGLPSVGDSCDWALGEEPSIGTRNRMRSKTAFAFKNVLAVRATRLSLTPFRREVSLQHSQSLNYAQFTGSCYLQVRRG
jgi:hypothetical protein